MFQGPGIHHQTAKKHSLCLSVLSHIPFKKTQVNQALHSPIPRDIANHRHRLAIDLYLIPVYGKPNEQEEPYLYRSEAKAGTTKFFAYATVYVIRAHQRGTLAVHAIAKGETSV
ncbi:hypothetical protein QQ91_0000075 (plasmid) [Lyngbya confervoides BDU141951]|uniref:Transposase n=1 Tax=Lyngbya confervoides BDU141951 TaxID=1574623 RepID=A0ABD4SXT0_9CYAN|nr:hypothetical protein [Lyngbya confervoides]MCM1981233.1 hypothetical protein [Lyngbya confervoides BDU141951]